MSNSEFYLIKLADIVNRKVKSVQVVEVKDGENCTVIVLEKEDKEKPIEMVILRGEGCNTCYGRINQITAKPSMPKELKAWIFDNYVSCI